jgi:hypothetical protein
MCDAILSLWSLWREVVPVLIGGLLLYFFQRLDESRKRRREEKELLAFMVALPEDAGSALAEFHRKSTRRLEMRMDEVSSGFLHLERNEMLKIIEKDGGLLLEGRINFERCVTLRADVWAVLPKWAKLVGVADAAPPPPVE